MENNNLKEIAAIFGSFVALLVFSFGLYQYYVAQKWKKSEFAAKQLDEFYSDPEILFCRHALDYRTRKICVPDKYKGLMEKDVFDHSIFKMTLAMSSTDWIDCEEFEISIYRDCFDRMFLHLETINHYLSIGLFSKNDISKIDYWLKELSEPRFLSDKMFFLKFLYNYQFTGVLNLMETFGIDYKEKLQIENKNLLSGKSANNLIIGAEDGR